MASQSHSQQRDLEEPGSNPSMERLFFPTKKFHPLSIECSISYEPSSAAAKPNKHFYRELILKLEIKK